MIKNIMMCIGYPFISIYLGTYMIFLIIMFSAVFSLTRFPPTFQFLLFLEKISTFLLWQESWNFWSHCPVQICSKQTLCIGRSVYWVGIVGNVLMVHLLMITLITIQLSIVTTVYNAVALSLSYRLPWKQQTREYVPMCYIISNIMLFF